jgi:hypothetical protein
MKKRQDSALRFVRIHVENWKNFASADVPLTRRVFLVGPNASGKSNFLDLFRFLRDLASPGGGLQDAVSRRGGVSAIRCLAARRKTDVTVHAFVNGTPSDAQWEYELVFNQGSRQRPIVQKERVVHNGTQVLLRPTEDDENDPERLTQTYLEQVNVNRPFRELGHFFASVRYLHVVPQLVREPDRSVGRTQDPFGGDFLEQVAKTPAKTRSARLRRILEALSVAVPQLKELEITCVFESPCAPWKLGFWPTEKASPGFCEFPRPRYRMSRKAWTTRNEPWWIWRGCHAETPSEKTWFRGREADAPSVRPMHPGSWNSPQASGSPRLRPSAAKAFAGPWSVLSDWSKKPMEPQTSERQTLHGASGGTMTWA